MATHPFAARLICAGTWLIRGEGCGCHLLEGEAEAFMPNVFMMLD